MKPLPIPYKKWREISMDFVVELPDSGGYKNLMVIVDRLSKGVILTPLKDLRAETVAGKFLKYFVPRHGFPTGIVSDRGTQFVGEIWGYICRSAGVVRRLSTTAHPQTDGQTERMNAVVEDYLRKYCSHLQGDWKDLLGAAELAINNRDASSTGVSPFFLEHGYHLEVIDLRAAEHEPTNQLKEREIAKTIIDKLAGALELAQAELAAAQQRMETAANRTREPAYNYQPGDKVWLDLRNVRSLRPSKKLDHRHAKYTVLEKIGTHAYRLNVQGIHDVFHTVLLRPAHTDPFPSQDTTDYQPPGILVDGHIEFGIDSIVGERIHGRGKELQYLVKWTGYEGLYWEPAINFVDTEALDVWEASKGGANVMG